MDSQLLATDDDAGAVVYTVEVHSIGAGTSLDEDDFTNLLSPVFLPRGATGLESATARDCLCCCMS